MVAENTPKKRAFCSKKCYGTFLHLSYNERDELQNMPEMGKLVTIDDNGFVALVNAIVDRAAKDYVNLPEGSHYKLDAERFFLTEYERLTGFNGREMLDKLDEKRRKRQRQKGANA